MAATQHDRRSEFRHDVLEFGMLWRPAGAVPERVCPVMVTNASIGGLQLRTSHKLDDAEELLLQLGANDGTLFIRGSIRYATPQEKKTTVQIVGFSFAPKTKRERDAVAQYIRALRDRICDSK